MENHEPTTSDNASANEPLSVLETGQSVQEESRQTQAQTTESPTELVDWLLHGMGPRTEILRNQLQLPEDAEDQLIARTLIKTLNDKALSSLNISFENRQTLEHISRPPTNITSDTSLIGQLAFSEKQQGRSIQNMDDVLILQAMIKGGNLWQRKAAILRLGELLSKGNKKLSNEQIKKAHLQLAQAHDVETSYERTKAKINLSGALGKLAKIENEQWLLLVKKIKQEIRDFWDGENNQEPIMNLPGDQRALLLLRTRDLEDWILAHINAVIEGTNGISTIKTRLGIISSLRNTSDERLVPALRTVLESDETELHVQTARTLGQIQNPQVYSILLRAFHRSTQGETRVMLAGLLALHGNFEHKDYVLTSLNKSESDNFTTIALEALQTLGSGVDSENAVNFLTHKNPKIALQAIVTLRHIGDLHALEPLFSMRNKTENARLRSEINDATEAIKARMDLRGEELPELPTQDTLLDIKQKKNKHTKNKFQLRFLGFTSFLWAKFLIRIGMHHKGIHRLQNITAKYPKWTTPWIALAMVWFKKNKFAQALPSFRRTLELDRTRIEQNPTLIRALVQCFIRRAEQMEKEGKVDVARGLIEEVRSNHLNQAPSALRFELDRYQESLEKRLNA